MSAPREKLTTEQIAIVLSNYDLGIVQKAADFPRGSHSAAKMVVRTDRGRFLIKRRPLGKDGPYRVAFSHSLQRYLASKNFPLPHLIGTKDHNNSMLKVGDAIYEVYEFIDGKHFTGGLVATYEAGKTLGLYHSLVNEFHPEWNPPRGHYHDAKMVYDAFKPMARMLAKHGAKSRGADLTDLMERLSGAYAKAAKSANALGMPQWETQIVHSDWHPGNLLFDHGHVVAVLDHDSARVRPRVMDVANGCLQFSMVTGGPDLSTWEARTDTARARRFLRGYDEVNVLTKAELAAVPFLMQEVLIAQTIQPILKSGKFARWDGFDFLQVILHKVQWFDKQERPWINLDVREE